MRLSRRGILTVVGTLLLLPLFPSEKKKTHAPLPRSERKEFVVSFSPYRPVLHPHVASRVDEAQLLTALYEGLVTYDPYDLHPIPALAQHWSVSTDGLTWTFYLRDQIFFQNGDPITAETFQQSWLNLLNPEWNVPYASFLDAVEGARAYRSGTTADSHTVGILVEGSDKKTLVVKLAYPAGHFIQMLCHHAFAAVHPTQLASVGTLHARTASASAHKPFHPIASGPFELQQMQADRVVLRVNTRYWDRDALALHAIVALIAQDPAARDAGFNDGSIHWISGALEHSSLQDAATLQIVPLLATEYLCFKTAHEPTCNATLRKALLLATPVEELTARYLFPARTLVTPFTGYPVPPVVHEYNPARARALLAEAKIGGKTARTPLKILVSDTEACRALALELQKAWTALALAVEIWAVRPETYREYVQDEKYHVRIVSWVADFADPMAFLELFRKGSKTHSTGWTHEEFEALLTRAGAEPHVLRRWELLAQAERILLQEAVVLPLSRLHALHAVQRRTVRGWYANVLDVHPFKFISLQEEIKVNLDS
ncbi:peptide ABC transporter substrate-binding protein [Treponema pallidum]|nr:peptide ABC transporter substrate-binding protein [Treponema pallidum]ADD72696.1 oligopeptide ABC transporter, periplasmic binding protein [Treponema pallidum subsp. pallidum str. Chicago]QUJ37802.2 peptide ABC transporter substrate-binding protein [Treponema pallidum]QUJ38766.2 peptide ABC transporter substrate-binding protein [Treponema pallidum]QUJ39729.2 peptide ABC transporter substrate-binding protein [Treponema pallidum]QUJ40688.2 peptide ABC transporter substrate-binding protein [Tr